ncbi:MAG: phenylpyruvate tautomerase MIF-related protein [Gammaproteobacteria bacterium]
MPYIKLNTNAVIDSKQSQHLLSEFSKLLAKETGKSERYVMVEVNGGKTMSFAGNTEPLAYLECKSVGLSSAQAKALSKSVSQVLQKSLNLPADRIYIEFGNCPAEFWGWNGSTFG